MRRFSKLNETVIAVMSAAVFVLPLLSDTKHAQAHNPPSNVRQLRHKARQVRRKERI
jgi:hypothetical protein